MESSMHKSIFYRLALWLNHCCTSKPKRVNSCKIAAIPRCVFDHDLKSPVNEGWNFHVWGFEMQSFAKHFFFHTNENLCEMCIFRENFQTFVNWKCRNCVLMIVIAFANSFFKIWLWNFEKMVLFWHFEREVGYGAS